MEPQDNNSNTQFSAADYPVEYDSLQAFRIQYLQMIAWFWADPKSCIDSYNTYTAENPEPTAALQWLADRRGGKPVVPWSVKLTLHFEGGPEWNPNAGYGRDGWISKNQTKFTLNLPVTKLWEVKTEQRATALAAFMRARSSLLATRTPRSESNASKRRAFSLSNGTLALASLPVMGDFREFDGVCARVLALSVPNDESTANPEWKEHRDFWDTMTKPHKVKDALSDWLDYKLPWDMDICFKDDDGAQWRTENGQSWWDNLTPNELDLFVPQRPQIKSQSNKSHDYIETIALACYNETGADHPLTCP